MKEKILSSALKKKRTELGLTQEEMAPLIGLKSRQYQAYERGEQEISREILDLYLSKIESVKPSMVQSNVQNNYVHEPKEPYGDSIEALKIKLQSCENENKALRDQVATLKELIALLKKES